MRLQDADWPDDVQLKVKKLFTDGLTYRQISEQLSPRYTRSAVIGWIKRRGITRSAAVNAANKSVNARTGLKKARAMSPLNAAPATPKVYAQVTWRHRPFAGCEPKRLEDRAYGECAFPFDAEDGGIVFCARRTVPDEQYCKAHRKIVYQPSAPRAKKAAAA